MLDLVPLAGAGWKVRHLDRQPGGIRLQRDFKNVHADVVFLADLGLIELRAEGNRKTLVPIARFDGIEADLGACSIGRRPH
jgi:hypothetical protein